MESTFSFTLCEEANTNTMKATERYDIFDPRQFISVQESTVVTRTWDSSCQIPDGSIQLTSWLTTVKKNLGLFYFIFVGHHNPKSIEHIRLQVPCRILK
uniref:R3H domain containing 1 n=1 Tax=Myotis myotis TaxID=51298 RepID=A0A7J7WIV1_MYOMY|nr:R3H domain containing 1 [Myotis myotis]